MNKTIKNVLIFGIPTVIIIVIIIIVIKEIRGKKANCPSGETMAFDGTCLQCDPQDLRCAVCTKDTDCNGGTCYMHESLNGKGVCICTGGFSGLNCEKFCTDDSDCNGGTCNDDGQCLCTNGNAPPDCKNPPDMKNCHPPNCNSILIAMLKCVAKDVSGPTALATIQILYYGISLNDGKNKTFEDNQNLTLGGFPKTGSWSVLNGVLATVRDMVSINVPNENEKCWYYCCGGGIDCTGDDLTGPFYPSVGSGTHPVYPYTTVDACAPPSSCGDATCFSKDCPTYNIVEVQIPLAKADILTVNEIASYQSWNSSAYIHFTDTTVPTCYNNTINGGTDGKILCEGCHPPWGPGKDVMNDHFGPGVDYPMGICGRKLPDYPIQIAAGDACNDDGGGCPDASQAQERCQSAFGNSSCYALNQTCEYCDSIYCRPSYAKCNISNFWSFPGSNCQTGMWNTCNQCSSTDGQNEQTAFYRSDDNGGCGAVLDPNLKVDCSKNTPVPKSTSCCGSDCYKPSNLLVDFPS